ncbi:MAG TPA: MYXO-CTERM sorting domain-containing protein [Polyangiaceae bacterium]|jgi:MYXO-CTERM domain-containing protein
MRPLPLSIVSALALVGSASTASAANTLQVGPGKTYAMPCDAIAAAQTGDTIEVDAAGTYTGNTCAWSTDGLTVTGVNGRAKIDITGVTPAQEKGIFTIGGTASATIENFELSGAAISAGDGNNGAGIRHQGLNLTVRNCYIHDNQDGILAAPGTANTGTILVESSEFSHNGAGDGFSHNMYIGDFAQFTLQFSYSHDGNVGHLFKSRAYVTNVFYNRITDETGGTASYEIDIPNGGTAYVIGNVVEQSATTQNPTILTFGEEGSPAGYDTHLYVVNNTFINDLGSGTFVADTTPTPAVIENNIFYKAGTISGQAGATLTTNFDGTAGADPGFTNVASYDVTLLGTSACIDKGSAPGNAGSQSLSPVFEYVHPLSEVARTVIGSAIDIGAYEYGVADDAGVIGPDAAPPDASGSGSGGSSGGGSGSGSGSSSGASSGSSSGSSSGTASSSGDASSSSGAGAGDGGNGASPASSGGCGCVLTSTSDSRVAGLGGLAALLFGGLARRRKRRA